MYFIYRKSALLDINITQDNHLLIYMFTATLPHTLCTKSKKQTFASSPNTLGKYRQTIPQILQGCMQV